MFVRYLLLFLLLGCTNEVPDSVPFDSEELSWAKEVWYETGNPTIGSCDPINVATIEHSGIPKWCGRYRCPPGSCRIDAGVCQECVASCTISKTTRIFSEDPEWYLVMVKESPEARWHELGHVFSQCSKYSDLDYNHRRAKVWCNYLRGVGGAHHCLR